MNPGLRAHNSMSPIINQNSWSLRKRIFDYLSGQIEKGALIPGSLINVRKLTEKLNVSRTPLREALAQLKIEGMKRHNRDMEKAIKKEKNRQFHETNILFHKVFLDLSPNRELTHYVSNLKLRLFGFALKSYRDRFKRAIVEEQDVFVGLLINPDRIGLTKPITVGIVGDAKKVAHSLLEQLSPTAGDVDREERKAAVKKAKADWDQELATMDHEEDDLGTTWNERCQKREPDKITARMAWRAIKAALPKEAIISSDIGNNCAIGNAYPDFEGGRKYLAPGMFGSCGYGFPAILGAKISKPDVPVVGFAGDGAFGISMNEMTACGRDEWPAITMII